MRSGWTLAGSRHIGRFTSSPDPCGLRGFKYENRARPSAGTDVSRIQGRSTAVLLRKTSAFDFESKRRPSDCVTR